VNCVKLGREAEGLDFARKYLMEQTGRHFFGEGADVASGYVPPAE
jgi:Fe-S cluster biosynthesis and repair protein YggX